MKNNLTEIVFILDRSGSMRNLTKDTIGGYNSFIEQQKKEEGDANITTVLFDNEYTILHDGVDIKDVKPLTEKEYYARGTTALYDAIGITINKVVDRIRTTKREDRPSKVIFVVTTDGYENASKEYRHFNVKEMIKFQQDNHKWEFLFLGANINSAETGSMLGIDVNHTANYTASGCGVTSVYNSLNDTITTYRSKGCIAQNWNDNIQ